MFLQCWIPNCGMSYMEAQLVSIFILFSYQENILLFYYGSIIALNFNPPLFVLN